MKININGLKTKLIKYFKEHLDQTIVIIILSVTIANAIFASVVFYLATLSPGNLDIGSRDYKYVRVKANPEVLERLDKRGEVDLEMMSEIEKIEDPFN